LVLDNTYLEKALYSLFQISIENLVLNKVNLSKNFHIQPSEIDRMPMWEYELFMEQLNSIIKKENKEQKEEMDKYHLDDVAKATNPRNLRSLANPQMPKVPNIKLPSIGSLQ